MSSRPWIPLRRRGNDGDDADYRGPFEGVPEWLFGPLWTWLDHQMPLFASGSRRYAAVGEYRALAMALRISLEDEEDPDPTDALDMRDHLLERVRGDPELLLDAIDFTLASMDVHGMDREEARSLAAILGDSGSIWRVASEAQPPALERRVGEGEQAEATALIAGGGRAAQHLAQAWRAVYGRDPDPTGAYRESVRAVEAAGIPVVSPDNKSATLGTMIRDMRAKPEKWRVLLGGDNQQVAVLGVVGMLDLLWKGQADRHGTADETTPIAVSPEEAQAALQLAMPLVRWFTDGSISLA